MAYGLKACSCHTLNMDLLSAHPISVFTRYMCVFFTGQWALVFWEWIFIHSARLGAQHTQWILSGQQHHDNHTSGFTKISIFSFRSNRWWLDRLMGYLWVFLLIVAISCPIRFIFTNDVHRNICQRMPLNLSWHIVLF